LFEWQRAGNHFVLKFGAFRGFELLLLIKGVIKPYSGVFVLRLSSLFFAICCCVLAGFSHGAPLVSTEEFLASAFTEGALGSSGNAPSLNTLWLTADIKTNVQQQFDYTLPQLRLRYWHLGNRTAWVLDEIGKERPITIGVVVASGAIAQVDILEYRETRGGEVQQAFFTEQFDNAQLQRKRGKPVLDRHINGITGATLSVRAVKKVAAVALFLDGHIQQKIAASHPVAH